MTPLRRNRPRDWPKVYFSHIPKAGGTTIQFWIRQIYPPEAVAPFRILKDLSAISREQLSGYRCYAGHFGTALQSLIKEPLLTATILRDPVESTLSHLRFMSRLPDKFSHYYEPGQQHLLQHAKQTNGDLALCLQMREFRDFLTEPQTRFLASSSHLDPATGWTTESWQSYHRQVTGLSMGHADMLPLATKNLDQMTAVGIYERFEDSADLLMYRLGLPAPFSWPQKNVSPERENNINKTHLLSSSISPAVLEDLKSLLQSDYAVYEHARQRFHSDLEITEGFPRELVRWEKIPLTSDQLPRKRSFFRKFWKRLAGRRL